MCKTEASWDGIIWVVWSGFWWGFLLFFVLFFGRGGALAFHPWDSRDMSTAKQAKQSRVKHVVCVFLRYR